MRPRAPLALSIIALTLITSSISTKDKAKRFLVYNPIFGRSHANFMGVLADSLVDAGHDVTVIAPVIDHKLGMNGSQRGRNLEIPEHPETAAFEAKFSSWIERVWRAKASGIGEYFNTGKLSKVFAVQCNATLLHPGLFENLKLQKFDAAIAEHFDLCGFAIFHHLGITKTAIASSMASIEGYSFITGLPSFPSYVPGYFPVSGDRMSFFERVANTLGLLVNRGVFPLKVSGMDGLFRQHFGGGFPSYIELLRNASLYFLNSEPLVDFPRPTLHRIIDIGGITVDGAHRKPDEKWSSILSQRKNNILISFGTVTRSHLMPEEFKNTILEVIRRFPDTTFIWKYEDGSHNISQGIDNLIDAPFVPQTDLLHDPRLSLFITHCGQGSTMEASTSGVPLIVIPVMGDQRRNAEAIKRLGTGIMLEKEDLEGTDKLLNAIETVLNSPRYRERAHLVGRMLSDKPIKPRELFVRNMEFLAEFGPLRMLDHYGANMNFIQFYLIDVFAFIITLIFLALYFITVLGRKFCTFTTGTVKHKSE